jgi:hypothetical protein
MPRPQQAERNSTQMTVYNGCCTESKRFSFPVCSNNAMLCVPISNPTNAMHHPSLQSLLAREGGRFCFVIFHIHSVPLQYANHDPQLDAVITCKHNQWGPFHGLFRVCVTPEQDVNNADNSNSVFSRAFPSHQPLAVNLHRTFSTVVL